jgi:DNA polymerase-1
MADKLLLIDGSSLIHRAFFALPPLTNHKGMHTGAVYGFLRMFHRLLTELQPRWVLVAFDKSRKTFRTQLFADYKGQRKETPPELKEQFPMLMDVLDSLQVASLELDDYEADDIIGSMARHGGAPETYIVTGDRDQLQLIDEKTRVMYTKRGITDIKLYDEEAFAEDYAGLKPVQLIDLKGLMGDASDNIPGVKGVGEKTALKLLVEYGSVENVLDHIPDIKGKALQTKLTEHRDEALLSKKLATIVTDVPMDYNLDRYATQHIGAVARNKMAELEFRGFYEKFAAVLGEKKAEEGTAAGAAPATPAVQNNAAAAVPARQELPADGMMGSLFGEAVPAAVPTAVSTLADWQALAAGLVPEEKIWFLTKVGGTIPHLSFTGAQLLAGGTLYDLHGDDVLAAFADWLATAPNPKGTVDCKETYRVLLCHRPGGEEPIRNLQDDLALAAYLEDAGHSSYALEDLAWQYLGQERAADCQTLALVAQVLEPLLQEKELTGIYRNMELKLARVLAGIELTGIAVDKERLAAMSSTMAAEIAALEEQARQEAGDESFNPNSPKQLGVILFEKFKLPVIKKTKSGYSTDVKVLEALRGSHPLVDTILRYRALAKLHSTYLEGLKPLINKETGRIHTHFQQTVAVTGRLSSVDPNLQNIPTRTEEGKRIRSLFVPGEGYDWLMSCDYSQIELRILAHVAQDPTMLEAFRENQDIHARTASEVFGVPLADVTHEMRSRAKAVNFGIVYGISDFGLSVQLGCSRKEAKEFIDHYLARYQGVHRYMEETVARARVQGFVSTLMGRRRYLPDINDRNFNRRSFAERTAINTPIQGTAADIMKVAMLRVDEALRKSGLASHVLVQVHDELVLEVKDSEKEATAKLVQQEMENAFHLDVPLLAEVNFGKDWAAAK